ncbi:MAG TPA: hypothetical protein GXZ59_05085 [Clostridiaceae bacterium]|nr:hypothetical protein [Clostridiaceae bacterium]
MSVEEKIDTFAALGVEEVFLMPLVPELYKLSAEEFLRQVMLERLNTGFIVVGEDAKFGSGRSGDAEFLVSWGKKHDVRTAIIADISLGECKVSSTRIRQLLRQGDVEKASLLMGRKFVITAFENKGRFLSACKLEFSEKVFEQADEQSNKQANEQGATRKISSPTTTASALFTETGNKEFEFLYPDSIVRLPEGKYCGQMYFQSSAADAFVAESSVSVPSYAKSSDWTARPAELMVQKRDQKLIIVANVQCLAG